MKLAKSVTFLWIAVMVLTFVSADTLLAQSNPCNPCGGKKMMNPCNPCGGKQAMNPCNPCGGKDGMHAMAMPAVNPCDAKMGTVFYIADPMARNTVSFESQAPLEDIVGTTNQISGYIVFDPSNPSKGIRGSIEVPVAGLATGIPLRDEHLVSEMWLDATRYPTISLTIDKAKKVRTIEETSTHQTYEATVSGHFALHGESRRVEIPIRITYLTESDMTRMKMPGNLLAGRGSFEVSLKDFGIKGMEGVVGSKVSDTIQVDVSLVASSQSPMAQAASNPCNPCGGKSAKNPCNPCGGKKS